MNKPDLQKAIEDVVWMAIRYADGRHTYAPQMVRDAVEVFKEVYPDFEIRKDTTIKPPKEVGGMVFKSDYLYDLTPSKDE